RTKPSVGISLKQTREIGSKKWISADVVVFFSNSNEGHHSATSPPSVPLLHFPATQLCPLKPPASVSTEALHCLRVQL
ncbi:hypothetical protein Bpfe_029645, partial [Biomphalaria pfeifferi]